MKTKPPSDSDIRKGKAKTRKPEQEPRPLDPALLAQHTPTRAWISLRHLSCTVPPLYSRCGERGHLRWRAAEPAAHPARRLDEGEDELEEQPGGQRDHQREGVLREGREGARDGARQASAPGFGSGFGLGLGLGLGFRARLRARARARARARVRVARSTGSAAPALMLRSRSGA